MVLSDLTGVEGAQGRVTAVEQHLAAEARVDLTLVPSADGDASVGHEVGNLAVQLVQLAAPEVRRRAPRPRVRQPVGRRVQGW